MSAGRARELPDSADFVIVGGGTAGAALAGILARDTSASVVLLEAGPDYGPFAGGRWPFELIDAQRLPSSHSWNYTGTVHPLQPAPTGFDRARVIGGCSAHNGCVALSGHRRDYDAWGELGNVGWSWEDVAPAFRRARDALQVRHVSPEDASPFHSAFVAACQESGLPRVDDLDNPDGVAEVGLSPVNIRDGVRWNTAFAYLDRVRDQPNLTIVDEALVDRVEIKSGRAVAVQFIRGGIRTGIRAEVVVLCLGAYGTPSVLLRSGVGPPDELRALGIPVIHPLSGVGRGLQDHPAVRLAFRGTRGLAADMQRFREDHWLPEEQALAKAQSRVCRDAFDIHVFSFSQTVGDVRAWSYELWAACLAPRSAGAVTLTSAEPERPPSIDHAFLTDPDGHDAAVLFDSVQLARDIASKPPLQFDLVPDEHDREPPLRPGNARDWLRHRLGIYFHPACTCRMGPAKDPLAVVSSVGRVHGLEGLYVCDASMFPRLMRANTNLPVAMLAEHLAPSIASGAVELTLKSGA